MSKSGLLFRIYISLNDIINVTRTLTWNTNWASIKPGLMEDHNLWLSNNSFNPVIGSKDMTT